MYIYDPICPKCLSTMLLTRDEYQDDYGNAFYCSSCLDNLYDNEGSIIGHLEILQ